jgi:ankyrin repeat protein
MTDRIFLERSLLRATRNNDLKTVKKCIKAGVNINIHDNGSKNTPLHEASNSGSLEIVRELIKAGANVNAKNYYGETPIVFANLIGDLDIIKELIKAGANTDIKNHYGKTLLDVAIINEKLNPHSKICKDIRLFLETYEFFRILYAKTKADPHMLWSLAEKLVKE